MPGDVVPAVSVDPGGVRLVRQWLTGDEVNVNVAVGNNGSLIATDATAEVTSDLLR